MASAVAVGFGYRLWNEVGTNLHQPAMWSSLACYVASFIVAIVASLSSVSAKWKERAALATLFGSFLAYCWCYVSYVFVSYGTDALLFSIYSAQLVAHGTNPYGQTMQPAFSLFDVSRSLVTPRADGTIVFAQSYPALNFLMYVPLLFLKINGIWLSVAAHVLAMVLLVRFTPRPYKVFAPFILFVDRSYVDYTLGSVTDIVWAVFAILAARYWRSDPVRCALFLGLAAGVKQTPWFLIPFALLAWTMLAIDRKSPSTFLKPFAVLLATFALPNVPFIVEDPHSWFVGVTTPVTGGLVTFGSGFAQLVTSNTLLLDQHTLFAISIGVYGAMLAIYALQPKRLDFLPFVAAPITLFFATRSLQNYFMFWPIVLVVFFFSPRVVSAATDFALRSPARRRMQSIVSAVTVVAVLALLVNASIAAPTLSVKILSYKFDKNTHSIDSIVTQVTNREKRHTLRFGVISGSGHALDYWKIDPLVLEPNARKILSISPPTLDSEPTRIAENFQVVAIDASTGDQVFSSPVHVISVDSTFANADLSGWPANASAGPIGWTFDPKDFKNGALSRTRAPFGNAVRFDVGVSKSAEWRIASLEQSLVGLSTSFTIRLKPDRDYVDTTTPLSIFGLEFVDSLGHHAYFAINSSLLHREIYKRDQFTYFVYPGMLHHWNTIPIDLRDLQQHADFLVGPTAELNFSMIAAIHQGAPHPTTSGEFGGVYPAARP